MYHYQYWLWSRDDIYSIKDTCISHFIEVLSLIFLKQVCYLVFFWNSLLGIPYPTKLGNFQYAFSSTPPLWLQNVVERNQTWILIRGSSSVVDHSLHRVSQSIIDAKSCVCCNWKVQLTQYWKGIFWDFLL